MKRLTLLLLALASGLLFAGCDDAGDDAVSKFNVLSERVNQDAAARENIIVMVEASSDVTWSASVPETDASWLKLVKTGGTGIGRVIFSLEANASIETRTTTLTVTGTTRDGRHPIGSSSVVVAQLGAAPSILIEPAGSVSLPADAVGAYAVAVTANLAWKAEVSILSGGEGWIKVTAPDATVAGSGEAVLSIAANETENAREAVLRIVHAADAELFAELAILQMRAPARYDLTIEGMDGTLPLGAATLLIAPAEGENLTRTGNVAVLDGNTSISYDEPLPEGEYTLVSVTPEGAGAVYLGGRFSIGAESVCTAMEHWYPVFESFGGGELVISGNYPLGREVGIAVNTGRRPHIYKEYAIEFRVPLNTQLERVEVNGVEVGYTTNKRGYVSVKRVWTPGDKMRIVLDYRLRADVQSGTDGKRWVAFSYGPLALAQRITQAENPEPFTGMKLATSGEREALLKGFVKRDLDGVPHFTVGDTGVELMPYCLTGSPESGPRTYFALSPGR